MRVFNCIFIIFFMVMLTLPLVFVDLSSNRVSEGENRMLAERPKLADIKTHPGKFVRDFDAWYKDSTGFREQLLKLYNVISNNSWLNGVVRYTEGQYVYLVGENGHHYFADVDGFLIPKFQGRQFLTDEQLKNMALKLEEIKSYLDNKSIPFVVMFCADKESVYPEFYPKSIRRGPEPIQLDVITEYLQEHSGVDVFNIRNSLLAEKTKYLLYYKIDTMAFTGDFAHYNQIGAFFAYRELMKHINKYFPNMVPFEFNDIDIRYDEKEIPSVTFKTEMNYKKLDPSFFDDVELNRPFSWENDAYENTDSSLPVILFLRDSYAGEQYIGKFIARHFGKAIFIHFSNIKHIHEYITFYNPDIVVFESAERALVNFFAYTTEIPEL
jgi:alginate O-acetyltransferase complex protein AlgJ